MKLTHLDHLRALMAVQNPIMQYQRAFNQEFILEVLAQLERFMQNQGERLRTIRKAFNIITESLQNVAKYTDQLEAADSLPIFVMDQQRDRYLIASGNLVHRSKVVPLKKRLDQINNLDRNGIQQAYLQVIRKNMMNPLREKNRAGLGLIEIARKSQNKLRYQFLPYGKDYYYFLLVATISKS